MAKGAYPNTGIYMIMSMIKPDRVYIGSAVKLGARRRIHWHHLLNNKHHSIKMQRHCNKYGIDDLLFVPIERFELTTREFLLERELFYIKMIHPYFNCSPNATSSLGVKHSDEYKQACRERALGRKQSPETIEKRRQKALGRPGVPWTNEQRDKIKESKLKNKHKIIQPIELVIRKSDYSKGECHWKRGCKEDPESVRRRISVFRGRKRGPVSEDQIKHQRHGHLLRNKLIKIKLYMAETFNIPISKEDMTNGSIPNNYVLVRMTFNAEGASSRHGIIYGILPELTYQDADNDHDDSSHIADLAEVFGVVEKTCTHLRYDPDDDKSMPWDCDMEVQVGDAVWFDIIESKNSIGFICDGAEYKLIPYESIFVARRTHAYIQNRGEWVKRPNNGMVIPVNGYILLEPVNFKKISDLDVTSEDRVDKTKGIVRYTGSCNRGYRRCDDADMVDLREGDMVLFDRKASPFFLERTAYNNFFSDKGELFLVVQRRKIAMVIDRP